MAAPGVRHRTHACVVLLCLSEVLLAVSESSRDYYDTLGVEPSASDAQIKKKFRQMAVKYHPDKNKSAGAEKAFREIAEAYQVLSNKEKRWQYDSVGHEVFLKNEVPVDPEDEHEDVFHFSFSDIFQDIDDGPFVEESYFTWSPHQDWEDEHDVHTLYEHNIFEELSFYFGDGDEED